MLEIGQTHCQNWLSIVQEKQVQKIIVRSRGVYEDGYEDKDTKRHDLHVLFGCVFIYNTVKKNGEIRG